MAKDATAMVIVPPRMVEATPAMVDALAQALRVELPGYQFQIVPGYVGRQSHDYFVEADGEVPDATVRKLQAVLARYGDSGPALNRVDTTTSSRAGPRRVSAGRSGAASK